MTDDGATGWLNSVDQGLDREWLATIEIAKGPMPEHPELEGRQGSMAGWRDLARIDGRPLTDEERARFLAVDVSVFLGALSAWTCGSRPESSDRPTIGPVPTSPRAARRLERAKAEEVLARRLQEWAERPERPMTRFRRMRIKRWNDLRRPFERHRPLLEALAAAVTG